MCIFLSSISEVEGDKVAEARENMGREGHGKRQKKDKKGREAGSQRGREVEEKFKEESVCKFFTAYDQLKNMKPLTFFDFHIPPPRPLNKILYARKRKFVLGLISVKFETFRGRLRHTW